MESITPCFADFKARVERQTKAERTFHPQHYRDVCLETLPKNEFKKIALNAFSYIHSLEAASCLERLLKVLNGKDLQFQLDIVHTLLSTSPPVFKRDLFFVRVLKEELLDKVEVLTLISKLLSTRTWAYELLSQIESSVESKFCFEPFVYTADAQVSVDALDSCF